MDITKYLSALLQFLVLLPAAASCYFTMKNQMKYTLRKTLLLCISLLLPFSFLAAWLHMAAQIEVNLILLPSAVLFFFLYRHTLTCDLPRTLAVYIGVCAVETFPAQFAYALDARLYPASGAAFMSPIAALFQLFLSLLTAAAFAYPACRRFTWTVDQLDFPKIWYSTVVLSGVFLVMNILCVPRSYHTLSAGRLSFLFPMLEGCAFLLLVGIYLLFYRGTAIILEHARLKEHSQFLEMQSHQYLALKEHMNQTARLRHDFRHSIYLLSSLAEKGDIKSIQTYLAAYVQQMNEHTPTDYCTNAALNALFGYYHEMAEQSQIEINWNIRLPDPLTFSELDIASLFGNLMENAIAGCCSVPQETRYFCLTAKHSGKKLYIVSTNSFDGKVRKTKDGYQSTKHSGKGTGLLSIAAIAEKYQGFAKASNNSSEFYVDIELKI